MSLTRDEFLAIDDITIKEITVPENIPIWGGKSLFIKQLNRGQQTAYQKRISGTALLHQNGKKQDVSGLALYGHEAWLCIQACCNEDGTPMFSMKDEEALNRKSGEALGWISVEIIKFSGMAQDAKVASGEITPEEALAEEIKNS